MLITLILCILWMRLINLLAEKQIISSTVSRKFVHIGTGPLFIICWLLFPDHVISRYLAAIVPLLIVLQVLLVGLGKMKDHASVQSMARTGERNELLKGPLFYGIVFVLITLFFWKSIHAIFALTMLCGGDGLADLIGSRIRSRKIPWAQKKTVLGSLSMFIGGFLLTILIIALINDGFVGIHPVRIYLLPLLLISLVATIVESITPSDYDNLTIPASALIFSLILF